MAYSREELKNGLPEPEQILIDFLLDSGVGPKHIRFGIVMKYAGKLRSYFNSYFLEQTEAYYKLYELKNGIK